MTSTYFDVGLHPRQRPAVDGDCTVDALVIGGGYAGVGRGEDLRRAGPFRPS